MKTFFRPSDIPFATDDAHRFLPWLIAIMVFMAALLLCLGITINSWVIDRHGTYTNSFTINIPAGEDMASGTEKIRALVQKLPMVQSVTPMSEGKLKELLKPWLGDKGAIDGLPLPAVLEVTLNPVTAAQINYDALQKELEAVRPGTEVDSHERWMASFSSFSEALQLIAAFLALVIIAGVALTIAFTARAQLKLHGKTVQLLHSIGAADGYVARQFQQDAFRVALYGAVPGCLIAGLCYWLGGMYMVSLHAPMMPQLSLSKPHLAMLLLMPLACGVVALSSARMAVLMQLRRVL